MSTSAHPQTLAHSGGSGPLHPLTLELARRCPSPRGALYAGWRKLLGDAREPMPAGWMGEMPFVASKALLSRIDVRIKELLAWLGPRLARRDDPAWPYAGAADVLSADLAIVATPEGSWDLRWVELQTFTSLVTTMYTLHRAAAEIWPELGELPFWGWRAGSDWIAAARSWMAPAGDSVLLESEPEKQPTRFDFAAVQHWFGLPLVEPHALHAQHSRLEWRDTKGRYQRVAHVANRLILHETPSPQDLESLLSSVIVGWNSHPAWFYRIDKGVMPDLPLPPNERCARADRWRELGMPPENLVAKAQFSYAGRSVRLRLDADALDGLPSPERWIVQPRYQPLALMPASDGIPLTGEIRCVVALPKDGEAPWIVARIARLTRGTMASAGGWSGAPGEGTVPVHAPPDDF